MAISRGVVLLGLMTLLVCLLLIKVSEADDSAEYPPIHAVKHDDSKCEGIHHEKGDHCRKEEEEEEEVVDDDVDDSYKVVNRMALSYHEAGSVNPFYDSSDTELLDNRVVVLGH
ncbi:uncharacterized protein LOC132180289 [Corylus avellana]|uniref:uncharacterized protein LOC132180289 n=1 Tax=Corylus avellana TaxID=13451 RepID=UPI00286AC39B|nr:uncharacterized protein LOC132180289 [Corylus avellana]